MPDIFDQLDTQAAPAPKGDIFDQIGSSIPTGPHDASQYFATHSNMDPLAVQQAFTQLHTGQMQQQPMTPEQERAQVAQNQGGVAHFGNAMAQTIAAPIQGAVGLVSPDTGMQLRQQAQLNYGPQTGAAGFAGAQAGNLVNAPYVMTGAGRALSAAEAMGNKRIDIAEERANGQDVSGSSEIARVAGTGALDYGMNVVANKVGGKLFGGGALGKTAGADAVPVAKNIVANFAKRFGADAVTNEVITHAQIAAQNLIDGRPVTEGMGAQSAIAPLIQTAAFAAAHGGTDMLRRRGEPSKSPAEQTPQEAQNGQAPQQQAQDQKLASAPKDILDHIQPDRQSAAPAPAPAPAPESTAPEAHPDRLKDIHELTDYYNRNNPNDQTGELLKSMAPHTPYEKAKVPVEFAQGIGESVDQSKVDSLAKMAPEDRQKLGPAILGPEGNIFDGAHRIAAAKAAGDTHVSAYVPEDLIGKHGIESATESAQTENSASGSSRESDPAKDAILLKQRDFLEAKSRNDPAADHLAAEVQKQVSDYEQVHGEDKAEDIMAQVRDMKHEPTPPHIANRLKEILSKPYQHTTADMSDRDVQHVLDTAGFEGLPPGTYTPPPEEKASAPKEQAQPAGPFKLPEHTVESTKLQTLMDTARQNRLSGGRRAGAMALPSANDMVGPGSIYHEEIKPKLSKLAEAGKFIKDTLKNTFPMETGGGSEKTAQVMREEFNKANNNQLAAQDAFEQARQGFDKLKPAEQTDFQRKMYNQEPQATPELQKIADSMYEDTNEGRQKLASLGNTAAQTWSDHWYNMMWKKDAKAADTMQKAMRPGAIEGKKGFLNKRALADFDEGLAKGLVPKYENPVEMFLATRAERSKFLAGYQGMDRLAKDGQIKRFEDEKKVPAGWEEVPTGTKGVLKDIIKSDGKAYAPVEVNRILKNIVEPSKVGSNPIYRILQDANNTITQSMLGLSAFHVRKVTQELINLQAARSLDLGLQGRLGEAGGVLKGSLLSPAKAVMNGGDIQKMMLGTKMAGSPEQGKVIDAMKTTFAAKADPAYETQFGRKFQKAISDGGLQGLLRAGVHGPLALNEKLMQKGVFGYVQRAKLHLGSEMIGDFLKQSPNATSAEINKEAAKVSDHLDNVLGLMNRDNLFWNRTARDLATLSTLSVGWNYGSGRALAGGLVDLGKGLGSLARGGKLSDMDTRRVSYLATTGMLTAFTGAITTYMATGKAPSKLRDLIFPPTGAKDRDGHDIRLNTGFYTSDWFDFMHHPVDTLSAKASPIVHAATDIARNKDFTGTKVYDNDDAWYKQAGQITKYLIKSGMPLSINQYRQLESEGTKSTGAKVAGMLGFKTAPRALSESDAEIKAHQILQERSSAAGRSPEEAEKSQTLRKYENELRDKNPAAMGDIRKGVNQKLLSPKDVSTIEKRANEPTGLKGMLGNSELRPDDLMKIWKEMTSDERRQMQWQIKGKIGRSDKTTPEKQAMFKQIAQDVRAVK
jgi:hypothetical protein